MRKYPDFFKKIFLTVGDREKRAEAEAFEIMKEWFFQCLFTR